MEEAPQRHGPTAISLSVVIPVYNNSATLDELIDRLLAVLEPLRRSFEIILVDDGSRDDSLAILQARAARDPRLRVFALVRNFGGQAAACAALDQVRGRHVVSLDADLENCPEDIPALLEPLEQGYDMVCGYRQERDAPWLSRRVPSRLMNLYVRRQTGAQIRDLGCGMKSYQAWVVRDLAIEGEARRLLPPVFLRRARRVTEVPLSPGVRSRGGGHSFLSLLGIALDYYLITARRPFLVSGLLAAVAAAVGMLAALAGAQLGGLVLAAAGLLGMLLSLAGEYVQRVYQLSQGVPFYKLRELDEEETAREAHELDPGADARDRAVLGR